MTSTLISRFLANKRSQRYWRLRQNKRYVAGLHVAAGRFKLGLEALDNMTRRKTRAKEKEIEKAKMKVMDYTITFKKVQAIRVLNKQSHE